MCTEKPQTASLAVRSSEWVLESLNKLLGFGVNSDGIDDKNTKKRNGQLAR